jgi:hypothetical protein
MKLLTMAMFLLIVNVIGTFGDQCTENCALQAVNCIKTCSGLDSMEMLSCHNRCRVNLILCNADCRQTLPHNVFSTPGLSGDRY